MAYISGAFLIDCPASALNNAGQLSEMADRSRYENWAAVKKIQTRQGWFPYVSAQAFRYWLREELRNVKGWTPSPVFREQKVAYTDANPIDYGEDDLFGYMRAPAGGKPDEVKKKKEEWKSKKLADQEFKAGGDDKAGRFVALTRSSPFRVSTLVSIAALPSLGHDYGSMSRHEGDPVLHEHEFYRTTLVGLFSVDLRMAGRFYHVDRTGYRHLDTVRKELAQSRGLKAFDNDSAYELPLEERTARVGHLIHALGRINGGAKLALHYTDVSPRLVLLAVAKGGNHLFGTAIGSDSKGLPVVNTDSLTEAFRVFKSDLMSGLYVGLAAGYLDGQRPGVLEVTKKLTGNTKTESFLGHPIEALDRLSSDLRENAETWLA